MSAEADTVPSPEEIRALRGELSRAAFGELIGVTGLTIYRWELSSGSPEARRPRGAVLARLLKYVAEQGKPSPSSLSSSESSIGADEKAALAPALGAMDDARLDEAENALVLALASGTLRSEASRAFASIMLARVQLLARHDTKVAFATLLGSAPDPTKLPGAVQLEYHLTAAFLHAQPDAQLFLPGKTNHHVALAEPLLAGGRSDHRFFLWYAQFVAALSLYEIALLARAMEGFAAVRDLATTPLHRCLAAEAATASKLGLQNTHDATKQLDAFQEAARSLPLAQIRSRIWRAEILVEEGGQPTRILALIDEAEQIHRRHRIANGIHVMFMTRNRAETLLRIGKLREAEEALDEALRVGKELAYTPVRLLTTLSRIHAMKDRIDEVSKLADAALQAEDTQRDITRGAGRVLRLLVDLHRGDAAADWCDQLLERFAELRRIGTWPVVYRQLAILSLAVAASKGALSHAERIFAAAEQAVEWSASPSASAMLRRHRATILVRRGRLDDARRLLEAALATFEPSGDIVETALVRRSLANVDLLEHAPGSEERMREAEQALAELELTVPPRLHSEARPSAAPALDGAPIRIGQLIVPLQRLATRGAGPGKLHKDLVGIVSELVPGRRVRLELADGELLEERGGADASSLARFELTDGAGRRFRLSVGEPMTEDARMAIELVAIAASMAFEVAALHGMQMPPAGRVEAGAEDEALAGFIAASPSMRRLKDELRRLSGSRATIIVTGESGTGKEVVAHAIHKLSRRAGHPYVTFNSAAVPRELFESQLFGHKRGSFTGAQTDHAGVIRAADGGTLFLDEIGELPLDVQPKLLRFLENGEVMPIGERKPLRVDVRIIAATHRDLLKLVREGKFREDLYYRLQVIPVSIAPLRDRRDDILALARHFIRGMTPAGQDAPVLTSEGEAKLLAHGWPGNVRELRNIVERAMAFEPLPRFLGAPEIRL